MISICPQTQSADFVLFREMAVSKIREYSRRVTRTATLDGGSVITDSGYTDTDRDMEVKARATEAQAAVLKRMFQTYPLLGVSTPDGYYTAAPQYLIFPPVGGPDDGNMTLKLLIQS